VADVIPAHSPNLSDYNPLEKNLGLAPACQLKSQAWVSLPSEVLARL